MDTRPQLIFLLHANRSGSTFLASSLADTRHVGVTIESTFFARLVEVERSIRCDDDVAAIVRLLEADRTYRDWGFDEQQLQAALAALPRPADVEAIARALLRMWFDGADPDYVVVKGSRLYLHLPRVRKLFRSAKFLHVVRDPRAVYNSQSKSIAPGLNMPMAHDPVAFARDWSRFVERLERCGGPDLMDVRYEDLIADRAGTMAKVCDFIATSGLPDPLFEPGKRAGGYFDKIPEEQKRLHGNVRSATPMAKRIDGWRNELAEPDALIVQRLASTQMARHGYQPVTVPATAGRALGLILRASRSRMLTSMRACRRYWFYLLNPAYLREAVVRNLYKLKGA